MSLGTLVLFLPFVLGPVVPPVPEAPPPSSQPTPESTLAPDVVPAVEDYNRSVETLSDSYVEGEAIVPEHVIHYDHGREVIVNEYERPASCRLEEKISFKDVCIPYTEKTCYTHFAEDCQQIPHRVCTGTVSTEYERACFDVDELICGLKEEMDYETLEEEFYVQLCTVVKERVCDTTFDIAVQTNDDFQCCELEGQFCEDQEVEIKDITCKETSEFDCQKVETPEDYGSKITQCTPVPIKTCYETPRSVRKEVCRPDNTRFCEKFSNAFPQPEQRQNCHFEPKKVCELQRRVRPKKARRYSYSPDCKVSARQICDQFEKRKVVPVCREDYRRQCDYSPKETCSEEQKEYCYKEEVKEVEEICDKLQMNVL